MGWISYISSVCAVVSVCEPEFELESEPAAAP